MIAVIFIIYKVDDSLSMLRSIYLHVIHQLTLLLCHVDPDMSAF